MKDKNESTVLFTYVREESLHRSIFMFPLFFLVFRNILIFYLESFALDEVRRCYQFPKVDTKVFTHRII